jgi:tetratricopeptide (TPR) repeat protein
MKQGEGSVVPAPKDDGARAALHRLGVVHARKGELKRAAKAFRAATRGLNDGGGGAKSKQGHQQADVGIGVLSSGDAYAGASAGGASGGGVVPAQRPNAITPTGFVGTESLVSLGHVLLADWVKAWTPGNKQAQHVTGARGSRHFSHLYRPADLVITGGSPTKNKSTSGSGGGGNASAAAAEGGASSPLSAAEKLLAELPRRMEAKLQVFDPALQQWSPRIVAFGGAVVDPEVEARKKAAEEALQNALKQATSKKKKAAAAAAAAAAQEGQKKEQPPQPNPYLEVWAAEVDATEADDTEPLPLEGATLVLESVGRKLSRLLHWRRVGKVAWQSGWSKVVVEIDTGGAQQDDSLAVSATTTSWSLRCASGSDAETLAESILGWKEDWQRITSEQAAAIAAKKKPPKATAANGDGDDDNDDDDVIAQVAAAAAAASGMPAGALQDPLLEEANQAFLAALARDEMHLGALVACAEVKRRRSQWRAAEPLLQRACRLSPKDACVAFSLAQTLEKLGRVSEASALFRTTNELLGVAVTEASASSSRNANDDDDFDGGFGEESPSSSSNALDDDDGVDGGLPVRHPSSFQTPADYALLATELAAVACYRLGRLLLVRGQRLEALASLSRAVSLQPTLSEAYAVLGTMLYEERRDDAAIDSFRHMITANSMNNSYTTSVAGEDDDDEEDGGGGGGGGMAAAGIWYKLGLALAGKGAAASYTSSGGGKQRKGTAAGPADSEAAKLKAEAVEALERAIATAERASSKEATVESVTKGVPAGAPWNWYDSLAQALVQAGRLDEATRPLLIAAERLACMAAFGPSKVQAGKLAAAATAASRAAQGQADDAQVVAASDEADPLAPQQKAQAAALPFSLPTRAERLEAVGIHLLRCWVYATRSLYEPPKMSAGQGGVSTTALLLTGGAPAAAASASAGAARRDVGGAGSFSGGPTSLTGPKWSPAPALFVSPASALPAPLTEPLSAAYERAAFKTTASASEFEGGSPSKAKRRQSTANGGPPMLAKRGSFTESFKESSATDRTNLPSAPSTADLGLKPSSAEWALLLAEAVQVLSLAQRLRVADFVKRHQVHDDEFGILAAAGGGGAEGGSSSSSSATPAVLAKDGVVSDPSVLTAIGGPLMKPTVALGCALLGIATPASSALAEALFAGLLHAHAVRASYPSDVNSPGFADAVVDVRGDAACGLGLVELCMKGHAQLADKLLRRSLELGAGAPAEVAFWCARSTSASVVAREPKVLPSGGAASAAIAASSVPSTGWVGGGEGTVRGSRGLTSTAVAYRSCLAKMAPDHTLSTREATAAGVLPLWHGLHAAVTLAGILVGQGLLLEASKVSRRVVQNLEPLLRKWIAPELEALQPGAMATAWGSGGGNERDVFQSAALPPEGSPAAMAAAAAKKGPMGRRRATPLYLLAAAAHETLGDALLPRGLLGDAEVAYKRSMEWRRELANSAKLRGGGGLGGDSGATR